MDGPPLFNVVIRIGQGKEQKLLHKRGIELGHLVQSCMHCTTH